MSRLGNIGVTVDLIVEDVEGILLVRRKNNPYKGYWALPGGFLNYGRESLKQAGIRELKEETNIVAKEKDLVLVGEYSNPDRDPRGHVIGNAFYVRKFSGKIKANDDADDARKFPRDSLPKLAFDHEKILQDYLEIRRNGLWKTT